jgi:CheY-like chemotaxis protein
MLTFSRQKEGERRPLYVETAVRECLRLVQSSLPPDIALVQHIAAREAVVLADAAQIRQVVMSLAVRAAGAMPEGGELTVTLSLERTSDGDVHVHLTVRDTGRPMSPQALARAFDPFVTDGDVSESPGFGLAVVHAIVYGHGGHLEAHSLPERGTQFCVVLPTIPPPADVTPADVSLLRGGTESILVVDDDPFVARSLGQLLKLSGYQVTLADGAAEALSRVALAPELFDLVLTDWTMPETNGDELCAQIHELRPAIRCILCSGHGDALPDSALRDRHVAAVLPKPVDIATLSTTVRRVLDQD